MFLQVLNQNSTLKTDFYIIEKWAFINEDTVTDPRICDGNWDSDLGLFVGIQLRNYADYQDFKAVH